MPPEIPSNRSGSSHNVLVNIPQGGDNAYNFIPAYFVQAC
ncbi:hypothetical protein ABH926_002702 [Catenulispora sp. GP43]